MTDAKGGEEGRVAAHWGELAAFLAVARHGGLSAAARATGSSAPTLGRRMRALERALGRELFVRRAHGYDLTEAGARLRDGLGDVEARLTRLVRPDPGEAPPMVRITAGSWTMIALAGSIGRIMGDPPDLRPRLLETEDTLSIARREAAIGFRNHRPTGAGLAGRRLRPVEFAPYARSGAPERWVRAMVDTPSARWTAGRGGVVACEAATPRLALDLVLHGVGRTPLPTFVGDPHPALERVGPVIGELSHDQWLVAHQDDRRLAEVRRALDRIAAVFGRPPA